MELMKIDNSRFDPNQSFHYSLRKIRFYEAIFKQFEHKTVVLKNNYLTNLYKTKESNVNVPQTMLGSKMRVYSYIYIYFKYN